MAENKVVIEFVGDVSGLKPAIDTLSQLGNLSEEQVNAFKKANDQFKQATKSAGDTEKSVSKLSTSFKQVSGAVAGKAIAEPLKELGKATEQATTKTVSLKAELRALKAQIAQLDEGTAEFEKLTQRAAQLEDQIGDVNERVRVLASDTFKFDAAVGAIRGVTAAFSVAQGAAALFGEENEDVQKALLKVQAATALLTGVQELANIATGQSAVKLAIENKLLAVKTFVTTQATVATRAFTAALIATGVGAAIVALGAIVAYWEEIGAGINKALEYLGIYEKTQTTVIKNSKDYNDKIKENIQLEEDLQKVRSASKGGEEKIRNLKLEIEILKALGAGQNELKEKTIELKKAELEQSFNKLKYIELLIKERGEGKALLAARTAELENYKQLEKQLKALNVERKELSKIEIPTLLGGENEKKVEDAIKKVATMYVENMKRANKDIASGLGEILGKLPEPPPIEVPVEIKNAADLEKFLREELPQNVITAVQNITDSIFQIAAQNRQAQFEEEQAKINENRERELANKNLTESQKAAIEKKYARQQQELKVKQFNADKQAAIAQASINGALAITRILATIGSSISPAAIAAIALTTIATGAQIAVISSQKAPKFAKGGFIGGKPHSQGGTLIEAEKDEFVVRKSIAKQNKSFLEAFNNGVPIAKALERTSFMPSIKDNDLIVLENKANIDYSKLGRAVAREMSKLPQSDLEVNYRGLLQSINSQQSLIEWQKRKYN